MKRHLLEMLIDSGLRNELEEIAKEIIRSKGGITKITFDQLTSELVEQGKAIVPDHVRILFCKKYRDISEG